MEQKFATDQKTIARATSNNEKLLKKLVSLEEKTTGYLWNRRRIYHQLVSYDDRINSPKSLRATVVMQIYKGRRTTNKKTAANQAILVAKPDQGHANELRRKLPLQNVR